MTNTLELSIPKPSSKVDVIIVGGGPVGLLAANLFVQAGMTVRIFDIENEPNHWGRGDWIHGRTLELLERAGLESELVKTGVKVDKITSYLNGKSQKEIPFVPEETESKYENLLCVGQHITESTLQSTLSQFDVQVERPSTVVHMNRDDIDSDYPIKATIMHFDETERTEEIECKYLLGCDGTGSDIRQQLEISYDGETTEKYACVIDALVRTNFSSRKEVCLVQSDHAKSISMFPRENGLTRIFVHFNENDQDQETIKNFRHKIQLEDIQREAKRALLPHRIEFLGILYWSVYVVGQRCASKFSSEDLRVFLCGDAAHSQSPTLGQGVNTGFGDVFNLVWKICLVEKGLLARKYLETYHNERWPVAQRVLSIDKIAAKAAAGHEAADYCEVVEKNCLFTSGYGINYTKNSTDKVKLVCIEKNEDSDASQKTEYVIKAGMRAPNFKVFNFVTGKKTRLFDAVQAIKSSVPNWLSFTVFVLANDLRHTIETVTQFLKETSKTTTSLPTIHTYIVTTSTADQVSQFKSSIDENKVFLDKLNQAQCHRLYHKKQGAHVIGRNAEDEKTRIVVVRPDGYISAILKGDNGLILSNQLNEYFSSLLI